MYQLNWLVQEILATSTIVSKSYRWNFLFYLQRLLLTIALAEQGPMDLINFGIHAAEHTAPIFDRMHL